MKNIFLSARTLPRGSVSQQGVAGGVPAFPPKRHEKGRMRAVSARGFVSALPLRVAVTNRLRRVHCRRVGSVSGRATARPRNVRCASPVRNWRRARRNGRDVHCLRDADASIGSRAAEPFREIFRVGRMLSAPMASDVQWRQHRRRYRMSRIGIAISGGPNPAEMIELVGPSREPRLPASIRTGLLG
jgi:hypothetical protein